MSEDRALADYHWLRELPGLSTLGCATLIAYVDIERASTVRSFWKFCGLAVVDGKAEAKRRGVKNAYCGPVKKMLLWEVATALGKKEKERLANYQAFYTSQHSEWTKEHVNMAARRRLVKSWAAKLWEQWRSER
ncbi:MAG: transposase [Patescibacteria group bacterium]|nr:transposase [Patescibacteria group bacterium]